MSNVCLGIIALWLHESHDKLNSQRLNSTFHHSASSFGAAPFEKFSKMLILTFEANSALSRENETKIVKITHSAHSRYLKRHHHDKKRRFIRPTTYYLFPSYRKRSSHYTVQRVSISYRIRKNSDLYVPSYFNDCTV